MASNFLQDNDSIRHRNFKITNDTSKDILKQRQLQNVLQETFKCKRTKIFESEMDLNSESNVMLLKDDKICLWIIKLSGCIRVELQKCTKANSEHF